MRLLLLIYSISYKEKKQSILGLIKRRRHLHNAAHHCISGDGGPVDYDVPLMHLGQQCCAIRSQAATRMFLKCNFKQPLNI
jgi:hypothetical protein